MEASIIIGIGSIAVGLIAGILTLWKTAGAKREKRKASYKEIITILIRSLTQSQINIKPEELDRIVRSKCRNCGINRSDLVSDIEIADDIFTNILENEFIAPQEKAKILSDIDELITKIPVPEVTEEVTRTIESPQAFISVLMAILGTITAMAVFMTMTPLPAPEIKLTDIELVSTIAAVIGGMIIALALFSFEGSSRRTKKLLLEKEKEETKDLSKNE